MSENLSVNDINKLAREHIPGFRLYNTKEIERMREDLANCSASLNWTRFELRMANAALRKTVEIRDGARAKGDYETSGALRDALQEWDEARLGALQSKNPRPFLTGGREDDAPL